MTDWPALVVASASLVASTGAAIAAVVTSLRMVEVKNTVSGVKEVVQKVETNTNSMSERLERSAHAAGKLEGGAEEAAKTKSLVEAEEKGRSAVSPTIVAEKIVTDQIVTGEKPHEP